MSLAQELEQQIRETKIAIDSTLEPVKDLKKLVVRADGLGSTLEQGVDHLEEIAKGFESGISAFNQCAKDFAALVETISGSDPQKVYEELTLINENLARFKENHFQKIAELLDSTGNIRDGQQGLQRDLKNIQETLVSTVNNAVDRNSESSRILDEKISRLARSQEELAKDLGEKISKSNQGKTAAIILNLVGFAVIAAILVLR